MSKQLQEPLGYQAAQDPPMPAGHEKYARIRFCAPMELTTHYVRSPAVGVQSPKFVFLCCKWQVLRVYFDLLCFCAVCCVHVVTV